VQYLYDTGLNPGDTYDIEVLKNGGTIGSQGVLSNSEKYALAFSFTAGSSIAWANAAGGSWSTGSSWQGGASPNQAGQTVTLGNAIASASVITLDGGQTVGDIILNSSNSYTIAPGTGGSLTLNNNGLPSYLTDQGGAHTISTPVALTSGAVVTVVNPGDSMTISGAISGAGGLTICRTPTALRVRPR